jgi:GWxTD domain-containing protein
MLPSILPRPSRRSAPRPRPAALLPLPLAALAALAACGGPRTPAGSPPTPAPGIGNPPPPADPVQLYRRMGLIAHGGDLPLTGRVSFVAGPTPDTTFALLTLAMPSRGLSFAHTGTDYRATYSVDASVRDAGAAGAAARTLAHVEAQEKVVVPNFRETTRGDESVLFQQVLRLPPGSYQLALKVRDGGSNRLVNDTTTLRVPRLGGTGVASVATPIPYYEIVVRPERAAVPRLLVTPRATVTFGRDSLLPLYLEAYDGTAVQAAVRGDGGLEVWRDSLALQPRGGSLASGILNVPVTYLGIGPAVVEVWQAGARDTARAPVFVSFGDELPAASFEDMLSYLRFFTSPQRLEALRRAPLAGRGAAWSAFLAATDPDPGVPGHQGLQQYFARVQIANQRYRQEGGVGWLTDRGMVYAAFGDPDQLYEPMPTSMGQRNRVQFWIYRERQLQLEFRDVNGFDRWELMPAAETEFHSALRRLHP